MYVAAYVLRCEYCGCEQTGQVGETVLHQCLDHKGITNNGLPTDTTDPGRFLCAVCGAWTQTGDSHSCPTMVRTGRVDR